VGFLKLLEKGNIEWKGCAKPFQGQLRETMGEIKKFRYPIMANSCRIAVSPGFHKYGVTPTIMDIADLSEYVLRPQKEAGSPHDLHT